MQTTTLDAALPPSAAILMAVDRVIGCWKNGATLRDAAFLIALAAKPGQSTKDYAESLDVAKPAITRITDHAVLAGLATRITDPANRRRVIIRPTAHGDRLARVLSGEGI
jgi:DNA-binding MarR family transcriptional regulator